MSIREDIRNVLRERGEDLFNGLYLPVDFKEDVLTSLFAGHNIILAGPPGTGKTSIALNLSKMLPDIEVIGDCPVNCLAEDPSCPFCKKLDKRESEIIKGRERMIRIQGSSEMVPEDLIGDFDPKATLEEGFTLDSFHPGKLFKANNGILMIDFIDRMPERVINTLLSSLEEGYFVPRLEELFRLDFLIIATSGIKTLERLPDDLIDRFDVIRMDYIDAKYERDLFLKHSNGIRKDLVELYARLIGDTRSHSDVLRGVSTRGGLRFFELLSVLPTLNQRDEITIEDVKKAMYMTLRHRMKVKPYTKSEIVLKNIMDDLLGEYKEKGPITDADVMNIIEEIASDPSLQIPLKYGFSDILLRRLSQKSSSTLSLIQQRIAKDLEYKVRFSPDQAEKIKITQDAVLELRKELKEKALEMLLDILEVKGVLKKEVRGYSFGAQAASYFLEMLMADWTYLPSTYYGEHSTGVRAPYGEGKIVGTRKYRFGDRYRDIAFRDTIMHAIKAKREKVDREDIQVYQKDVRSRVDIVLAMDISGTMEQGKKLFQAKKAASALSLASANFGDRVGVVSFSEDAEIVCGLTDNPSKLTSAILDLTVFSRGARTNIGDALIKSRELFTKYGRSTATRHIILITDGDPTAPLPNPRGYAVRHAAISVRRGITISGACILHGTTEPEFLRRLTKIGKGRIYGIAEEALPETILREHALLRGLKIPSKIEEPIKKSVVDVLSKEGPVTLTVLSKKMGESLKDVSEAVEELEKEGIVGHKMVKDIRVYHLR